MRGRASGNSEFDERDDVSSSETSGLPHAEQAHYRSLLSQTEEFDIRHSQKMEALARLASGISHDYNNLLTVILGHVDLMMIAPDMHAVADSAAEIRATVFRGAQLARQLMTFSQRTPVTMLEVDLNQVVTGSQPMLRRLAGDRITLRMELDSRAPMIQADVAQLEQILSNLTTNARDAMPAGGTLHLSTKVIYDAVRTAAEGEPVRWVCLSVSDTGVGMNEETKSRIFEPFFTTKPAGEGKGLGLAAVYGAVAQARGRIFVRSTPDQGTTFDIVFPAE